MKNDYITVSEFCALFNITKEEYYKLKDDSVQMKKIYRKAIKVCHPDTNPNEYNEELTKKINAAFAAFESKNVVEEYYSEPENEKKDDYERENDYTKSNDCYEYEYTTEERRDTYKSKKSVSENIILILLAALRIITLPIRALLFIIAYLVVQVLGLYSGVLMLVGAGGFVYCIGKIIYMIGTHVTDIQSYLTYIVLLSIAYAGALLLSYITEWFAEDATDWLRNILFYWEVHR